MQQTDTADTCTDTRLVSFREIPSACQQSSTTMSAAARAEARRKAILSRGSDRLAKLTSSARGDDAAAFAPDGP